MYTEFNTPVDPYPDPEQLRREARDYWHDTLAGVGEVEERVKTFMARYAGAYKLQGWSKGGREKTREGYNALGGRKRQSPEDAAGKFGRFVVTVGLPFETSDIDFGLIPELAPFRDLPEAQFDQEVCDIAQKAVERLLGPGVPYALVVDRGAKNGHNHLHVAHPPGACPVGRKTLNETPQDALKCARYFAKGPTWGHENLVAYVNVRRLQGRPAKRLRYGRLGSYRVTCADVVRVLGFSVLRPKLETNNHEGHCGVPAVPPADSVQNQRPVILAHPWYGGAPQPIARELLEPEPVALHRTLPGILQKFAKRPLPVRPARRQTPPRRHRPALVERWGMSPPVTAVHIVSALPNL